MVSSGTTKTKWLVVSDLLLNGGFLLFHIGARPPFFPILSHYDNSRIHNSYPQKNGAEELGEALASASPTRVAHGESMRAQGRRMDGVVDGHTAAGYRSAESVFNLRDARASIRE
jgi:hypothetical protein